MLEERAEFPVKMMARLLGVSRSGFYSWLSRGAPEDEWAAERAEVERVWRESDGRFGHGMVRAMMPPETARITLYRVLVLMRELGIRGCTPNARKRTTVPGSGADGRPDLIGRDFESPVPTCKLVGDITYLRTGEGWLFLSTVIDLATRMVVGWALSERMTADIVTSALESARSRGYVAEGAIFHSDRGAQYTSRPRGEAVGGAHGLVPRQRHGRVVLRHAEERDVPPRELSHPRRGTPGGGGVHRGLLQPPPAPLHNRLPDTGAGDGRVLRENRAAARGAAHGGLKILDYPCPKP